MSKLPQIKVIGDKRNDQMKNMKVFNNGSTTSKQRDQLPILTTYGKGAIITPESINKNKYKQESGNKEEKVMINTNKKLVTDKLPILTIYGKGPIITPKSIKLNTSSKHKISISNKRKITQENQNQNNTEKRACKVRKPSPKVKMSGNKKASTCLILNTKEILKMRQYLDTL